jgi:hypothetical protein
MSLASDVRLCLSEWITQLLDAVPIRSRATFVELLCACMISPEGWVTRAIAALRRKKHWTTYYKLIERGHVQVLPIARAVLALILQVLGDPVLTFILDDTLVPRTSDTAPGCAIRHDHANKANRPQFLLAQCWLTLGVSVCGLHNAKWVLPILSRLVPSEGNRNKLVLALQMIRDMLPGTSHRVRVLFDCWFMRARLVLPLLEQHCSVIGQARIDTALFLPPGTPHRPRPGRKRKYGERLTRERIDALPSSEFRVSLYGKEQRIRLRSIIAVARFLKGTPVRAVWCEFFDPDRETWTKPRLLLASELGLSALAVVQIYARRWGIEPLFHNLKRWWGVSNLWQQSQSALELWMQIRSTAWVFAQLLTLVVADAFPMQDVAPWRARHALTAGLVAQWMRIEFTGLAFRDGFNKKSQKFSFPTPRNDPRMRECAGQSP